MAFYMTDDPVRDAEAYQRHLENSDRDYIGCDICGGKIYRSDATHDGDDYYKTPDGNLCEDCGRVWLRKFRRECC